MLINNPVIVIIRIKLQVILAANQRCEHKRICSLSLVACGKQQYAHNQEHCRDNRQFLHGLTSISELPTSIAERLLYVKRKMGVAPPESLHG